MIYPFLINFLGILAAKKRGYNLMKHLIVGSIRTFNAYWRFTINHGENNEGDQVRFFEFWAMIIETLVQ
jgi:hypothetical protein